MRSHLRRGVVAPIVLLVIGFAAVTEAVAQATDPVSMTEFVDMLMERRGTTGDRPVDFATLPGKDRYETDAGILVQSGLSGMLLGMNHGMELTRGYFASFLYDLVKDPLACEASSEAEKIQCLVDAGILQNTEGPLERPEVLAALNHPMVLDALRLKEAVEERRVIPYHMVLEATFTHPLSPILEEPR